MSEKLSESDQVRLAPAVLKTIDDWRGKQPDLPDRAEAIRRLVGLSISSPTRSHSPKPRSKAADMAAEAIDRHADRSATSEEQESRKRRLLKGPKEFRDLRRDHPKQPSRTARPTRVRFRG
jgi:hypothetical protein